MRVSRRYSQIRRRRCVPRLTNDVRQPFRHSDYLGWADSLLFLADPTPSAAGVRSWRPDALAILERIGFGGTVLVPERSDWQAKFDYLDQVEWEFVGLERATVIAFWVPRNLDTLPGFTTHVEFDRYRVSRSMRRCGRQSQPTHA